MLIDAGREVGDDDVVSVLKGARDVHPRWIVDIDIPGSTPWVIRTPWGTEDREGVEDHVRSYRRLTLGVLRALIEEGEALGDTEVADTLHGRLYAISHRDVSEPDTELVNAIAHPDGA